MVIDKTKTFLSGFYSPFGLELLSSIDFIMIEKNVTSPEEISKYLNEWSERKQTMFNNPKFVSIAIKNLQQHLA